MALRDQLISTLRDQLISYAKAYVDTCERDATEAKKRLMVANRIVEYLKTEKPVGNCPMPLLDETSAQAQRFAARVNTLLLALYDVEMNL